MKIKANWRNVWNIREKREKAYDFTNQQKFVNTDLRFVSPDFQHWVFFVISFCPGSHNKNGVQSVFWRIASYVLSKLPAC